MVVHMESDSNLFSRKYGWMSKAMPAAFRRLAFALQLPPHHFAKNETGLLSEPATAAPVRALSRRLHSRASRPDRFETRPPPRGWLGSIISGAWMSRAT